MSAAEFRSKYVRGRLPVLIRGLAKDWPSSSWMSEEEEMGKKEKGEEREALGSRYVNETLTKCNVEHSNMYVNLDKAPRHAAVRASLLGSYSNLTELTGDDLLSVCYADLPKRWLLASGLATGSNWHVDPLNTSAWNTLLHGVKRWALYPPSVRMPPGARAWAMGPQQPPAAQEMTHETFFPTKSPQGRSLSEHERGVMRGQGWWGVTAPWRISEPGVHEWFARVLPRLEHEKREPLPLQCTQRAGDTLFVPSGYWHAVLNLRATNYAFTHNFGSAENIEEVAAELSKRPQGSAPRHCLEQLQRLHSRHVAWFEASESTAAATTKRRNFPYLRYSGRGVERLLLGAGAGGGSVPRRQLLLFLSGDRTSDGAVEGAARALAKELLGRVVIVGVPAAESVELSAEAKKAVVALRKTFGVTQVATVQVRMVELGAVLFKHLPPPDVLTSLLRNGRAADEAAVARTLRTWCGGVLSRSAQPTLTAADRAMLAQLMQMLA